VFHLERCFGWARIAVGAPRKLLRIEMVAPLGMDFERGFADSAAFDYTGCAPTAGAPSIIATHVVIPGNALATLLADDAGGNLAPLDGLLQHPPCSEDA
jgi:hypothetical protein